MYDTFDYDGYNEYQDLKNLHENYRDFDALEDIRMKNMFANYEREQEMRAFLSDPDYQASLRG